MRDTLEHLGPGRWLLPPMPTGDADALQRLAADWRELAALLDAEARRAASEVDRLRRNWSGQGSLAAPTPLQRLLDDTATVCRALREAAEQVEALALALLDARERHDWSWRKAIAIGAVVVVSAAAVAITVGSAGTATPAAAAAESAAVGAAAAEMAAASTTALVARAVAARALLSVAQLARTVQAVRAVVVPRLVLASMQAPVWIETPIGAGVTSGAIAAGLDLVDDEDEDGVDWLSVAFSTLVGAGEVYAVSPGRSRGYRLLGDRDYERMSDPGVRAELIRIPRATWPQWPRAYRGDAGQLESHYKHAPSFGLSRRFSPSNARLFDVAMRDFVFRPETVRISGTWRGDAAVIYADYDANIAVVTRPNGDFWTVLVPGARKRWHLWYEYRLGGG
jgi:uncharacterized protein YukE